MLYYNRDKLDIIMKIHIVNNLSCVWMDMSNIDYALWRGFQRQVCYLDALMVDARSPFTGPIFYCTSLLLICYIIVWHYFIMGVNSKLDVHSRSQFIMSCNFVQYIIQSILYIKSTYENPKMCTIWAVDLNIQVKIICSIHL